MFGLLKSVVELAGDAVQVVAAPVEIAVDLMASRLPFFSDLRSVGGF